jgi:hypothetical protein
MPDPILARGDRGPEVALAQDLLNRAGALLDPDGDFGPATARAVAEFRAASFLLPTGLIDAEAWAMLRALPEPSPDIPTSAVTFIAREEVGGRDFYDRHAIHPEWPGGASGVTIGVGYDLGYQAGFAADWQGLLPAADLAALLPWIGATGARARDAIPRLAHVTIPWHAAWQAYLRRTLPAEVARTRRAFTPPPGRPLSPLALGVLVSLVYNRGAGMTDPPGGDSRREMRDIRDAIAAGDLARVPDALLSMRRLWPAGNGLIGRREREARLFRAAIEEEADA